MAKKFKGLQEIVHLKGIGLTRQLYLNGELLSVDTSELIQYSDSFNWGYIGDAPMQSALSILLKLLPAQEAVNTIKIFTEAIVAGLPSTDFDVRIHFKKFMDAGSKNTATYFQSLIDFKAQESYFPFFLYFLSMSFKTAEFAAGTIEHSLLRGLSKEQFTELKKWTAEQGKHRNYVGKEVYPVLSYDEAFDIYTVQDSFGLKHYTGIAEN